MITRLLKDPNNMSLTREQLTKAIVNNNEMISSSAARTQRTNEILQSLENIIFQDSASYANLVQQCQTAEKNSNALALSEAKTALKNLLTSNQQTILQQITSQKLLYNIDATDYGTVFGQMKSILVNSLTSGKHLTLYTNSAIRIGGFVQETMELQALREFFERSNTKQAMSNVYLTGSKTITLGSGHVVDSPMDLIISDLKTIDEAFNAAVTASKNVDQYLSGQLSYNDIVSFGVQSKSWNITSTTRFYEVGNRTELLNSFKSSNPRSYHNVEKAIDFLAKTPNTLTALGPMNVLFRTGNQRFWMDEFLQEITRNMQLIFASKNKNYYEPSQEVGFTQAYINYKNTKGIQRKQYRRHKR